MEHLKKWIEAAGGLAHLEKIEAVEIPGRLGTLYIEHRGLSLFDAPVLRVGFCARGEIDMDPEFLLEFIGDVWRPYGLRTGGNSYSAFQTLTDQTRTFAAIDSAKAAQLLERFRIWESAVFAALELPEELALFPEPPHAANF